jgi:hypothetical protein
MNINETNANDHWDVCRTVVMTTKGMVRPDAAFIDRLFREGGKPQ